MTNLGRGNRNRAGISPARLVAFEVLRRVEEEGAYASVLLANREADLNPPDRALTNELTLGVLRRQLTLDRLISHYANREAARLDPAVRIALRLGLYQLRFLSRIPASAAVNEAVKLVRYARVRSADALVNAVLRRAVREPDYDPAAELQDPIERITVETSHPRWLIERWIQQLGLEEASAFAKANNEPAPVSFRVTKSGESYIQDRASQLVSEIFDPQPGERILDLCAAPGSKTTHIATLAGPTATVIAADLHLHRLRTVSDAARSQGLGNIRTVLLDGRRDLPFEPASFDRVLVDAPCSGTGTLRRNPEIRWRLSPDDLRELSDQQLQLLRNAADVVKPGGRLVYSTCSVEREENEGVVAAFLKSETSFRPDREAIRTWPHREGTDGFFIASFEKAGE